jgi:hypothetical protein
MGSAGTAPHILHLNTRREWSTSRPGHFTPWERAPGTHWIGGGVDTKTGLDVVEKRKIPSPSRESNPRNPIVQIVRNLSSFHFLHFKYLATFVFMPFFSTHAQFDPVKHTD